MKMQGIAFATFKTQTPPNNTTCEMSGNRLGNVFMFFVQSFRILNEVLQTYYIPLFHFLLAALHPVDSCKDMANEFAACQYLSENLSRLLRENKHYQ